MIYEGTMLGILILVTFLTYNGHSTISGITGIEEIEITTADFTKYIIETNRQEISKLDDESIKEKINKGYFYTCNEVSGYCNKNPTTEGCIKYCPK